MHTYWILNSVQVLSLFAFHRTRFVLVGFFVLFSRTLFISFSLSPHLIRLDHYSSAQHCCPAQDCRRSFHMSAKVETLKSEFSVLKVNFWIISHRMKERDWIYCWCWHSVINLWRDNDYQLVERTNSIFLPCFSKFLSNTSWRTQIKCDEKKRNSSSSFACSFFSRARRKLQNLW